MERVKIIIILGFNFNRKEILQYSLNRHCNLLFVKYLAE